MRIVVTGGTGFIGREVVDRLLESGSDELVVTTRNPEQDPWNGRVRLVQAFAGDHVRTGFLAAVTSSGRQTGVVLGASWRASGSSSAIARRALANASRVSRLSVSVGSIIRASGTISGK